MTMKMTNNVGDDDDDNDDDDDDDDYDDEEDEDDDNDEDDDDEEECNIPNPSIGEEDATMAFNHLGNCPMNMYVHKMLKQSALN